MTSVADWLETAATWQFASLLFQTPSARSLRDLHGLAREVAPAVRPLAGRLTEVALDAWDAEYHRVLGPGGVPACESSYDDNALAGRGPLLSRVAGFYDAFAYRPDDESPEVPDHVSIELGFLGYLALKAAFAMDRNERGRLAIVHEAYDRFLGEHLSFWFDRFAERITGSDSALYGEALAVVSTLVPALPCAEARSPQRHMTDAS